MQLQTATPAPEQSGWVVRAETPPRCDGIREVILALAQEVYVRLVQNDGRILQPFRGKSEFAAKAFLARIAASVVVDHFRY